MAMAKDVNDLNARVVGEEGRPSRGLLKPERTWQFDRLRRQVLGALCLHPKQPLRRIIAFLLPERGWRARHFPQKFNTN